MMKPTTFENAIRLQFDTLVKRVIDTTVKDYDRHMKFLSDHEKSFCELPEIKVNSFAIQDDYEMDVTVFDVHVFDTSKFTVDGAEVTTAPIDLTYYDFSTGSPVAVYQGETKEAISDGYFHEGELRAAPTFALRIDGIIEDADPVA